MNNKQLREKSQDFAVRYYEALAEDDYELAEKLTLEHLTLFDSQLKAGKRKAELRGQEVVYKAILDRCKSVDLLLPFDNPSFKILYKELEQGLSATQSQLESIIKEKKEEV